MSNFTRIKEWSDERLITQQEPDRNGFISMIVEECGEFLAAESTEGRIDAMAYMIVTGKQVFHQTILLFL